MTDPALQGRRILIAEDEYTLAEDMRVELADAGATVIGPAPSVAQALDLVNGEPQVHGAILDVNLRGETVFPVADWLAERRVPFIFTTGYDAAALPPRYSAVLRCEKPVKVSDIANAMGRVLQDDVGSVQATPPNPAFPRE